VYNEKIDPKNINIQQGLPTTLTCCVSLSGGGLLLQLDLAKPVPAKLETSFQYKILPRQNRYLKRTSQNYKRPIRGFLSGGVAYSFPVLRSDLIDLLPLCGAGGTRLLVKFILINGTFTKIEHVVNIVLHDPLHMYGDK
jgi:hypothetical protein